jgi:uncharacterized protein
MTNERRFVFYINVIISAFLFEESKPYQALDKAQNLGILLMSRAIVIELIKILNRPKFNRYLFLARRQ